MVHRQYTMHGLPHSRLSLAQQQAVAHQLQLECRQWITLDLITSMLPFFPHVMHTWILCLCVEKLPSSRWAEWQCSQMMCATVQPLDMALTAASTHYFSMNYGATHFQYLVKSVASSSDKNNCSWWGWQDSMSATMFNGPLQYTMVMGNSFIHSNHLA